MLYLSHILPTIENIMWCFVIGFNPDQVLSFAMSGDNLDFFSVEYVMDIDKKYTSN